MDGWTRKWLLFIYLFLCLDFVVNDKSGLDAITSREIVKSKKYYVAKNLWYTCYQCGCPNFFPSFSLNKILVVPMISMWFPWFYPISLSTKSLAPFSKSSCSSFLISFLIL